MEAKKSNDNNKCFVNLTYKCNNRCISCIMPSRLNNGKEIKKIKEEIDEILKKSSHIEFNGGEPALNPYLFRILEYTKKKNPQIEISLLSNLQAFSSKKNAGRLAGLKLRNFKAVTTIYGPNSKIHNAITRNPESFQLQIKGIKNLIERNISIELRIVINKANYKHLAEIAEFIVNNFSPENFMRVVILNMKIYGEALKNKKITAYKLKEAVTYAEKAVQILEKNRFRLELFHFPHCIMPKWLWNFSKGVTAEKSEILFLPQCEKCSEKNSCSGIWKSYVELFGSSEFNAIEDKKD